MGAHAGVVPAIKKRVVAVLPKIVQGDTLLGVRMSGSCHTE
jgi:hypothetical protein